MASEHGCDGASCLGYQRIDKRRVYKRLSFIS
jgi:hypothetical protein